MILHSVGGDANENIFFDVRPVSRNFSKGLQKTNSRGGSRSTCIVNATMHNNAALVGDVFQETTKR